MQRFLHVLKRSCFPHLPKYLVQKKCCCGRESQSKPKDKYIWILEHFWIISQHKSQHNRSTFTDLPAITLVTCGFLFSHIHPSLFFLWLLSTDISHSKPNFSLATVFCHDAFPSLSFCFPLVVPFFSAAMPLLSLFPLNQLGGPESWIPSLSQMQEDNLGPWAAQGALPGELYLCRKAVPSKLDLSSALCLSALWRAVCLNSPIY